MGVSWVRGVLGRRECRTSSAQFQMVRHHFIIWNHVRSTAGAGMRAPRLDNRRMQPAARPPVPAAPVAPGPSGCSAAGGGASRRPARTAMRRSARWLSVLLFLAAIISAFWYLRNEEFEREQEAVKRDTEVAQQQIRLRLIENQEQLVRMARELVDAHARPGRLPGPGRAPSPASGPRSSNLIWLERRRATRSPATPARRFPPETGISGVDTPALAAGREVAAASRRRRSRARARRARPVYSRPFRGQLRQPGVPGRRCR